MSVYFENFVPDKNYPPPSDWGTIGSLSLNLPYEEMLTTIVASLCIGTFFPGDKASHTYYFRIVANGVSIMETTVTDFFTNKVSAILPLSLMGATSYNRRAIQVSAQWMVAGSANGYIPANSKCAISVILEEATSEEK